MNEHSEKFPDEIPSELYSEFAEICRSFAHQWQDSNVARPDIRTIAQQVSEDRRRYLIDVLLALEIKLQAEAGETVDVADYHRRFPDHRKGINFAMSQIGQFGKSEIGESRDDEDNTPVRLSPENPDGASDPTLIPEQIGRFKVRKRIGSGAFGIVCLAHDQQLARNVAIKFARHSRFETGAEVDKFVREARTAAQLEHPGIVTVFDVLQKDDLICIVQQYIQGSNLRKEIDKTPPRYERTVEVIRDVADAIGYAHQKGFVHRDIKPSNILIDTDGKPHVADFGLAVHESAQRRLRGERSGTPRYMSPEMVLGETHRLDGRSDLWSLGVMMYEMLTGKHPFYGGTQAELFDEIKSREPKPPRQLNPKIPAELERICLKLLSKRIIDRYTTAADLVADLAYFLESAGHARRIDSSKRPQEVTRDVVGGLKTNLGTSNGASAPDSVAGPKIVPKGIRPFDVEDADFFLQLLPGPRDRRGLPESIRFWLNFVQETKLEKRQSVGLIYGPSGCGKSSFVKAGLIPRLDKSIVPIYIEATANETEERLRSSIRNRVPEIEPELGLPEMLDGIREGLWLAKGNRLLLVIDQFEQWLHNRNDDQKLSLIRALRQCDGERVQCILTVRDDFWLATNRFLHALETDLLEGKNATLMDLFDKPHSRKILAEFGQAYGRLPEKFSESTKSQQEFLDRAIDGLAEDGKIICVHLALFAEMFKGKDWTPRELSKIGGTEGVGFAFFEDTFSSKTSSPECKFHAEAAKKVLHALLPEPGADIRGKMHPINELVQASGYAEKPSAFKDLLRILDRRLRLITLTDPEGIREYESDSGINQQIAYYQLTHDYLVRPLRSWLVQEKKLTMVGRAEIRLTERCQIWSARPTNQYLPGPLEFAQIRTLTSPRNWTPTERRMMGRSTNFYFRRVAVGLLCVCAIGWMIREAYGRIQANSIVARLMEAETGDVPGILMDMKSVQPWVESQLAAAALEGTNSNNPKRQLHIGLALELTQGGQGNYLLERLCSCQPNELPVILSSLTKDKTVVSAKLRDLALDESSVDSVVLRTAAALASWDPDNQLWDDLSQRLGKLLLDAGAYETARWESLLWPIRTKLLPVFAQELATGDGQAAKINELYHSFSRDLPEPDAALMLEFTALDVGQAKSAQECVSLASRKANLFVALTSKGRNRELLSQLDAKADLNFVAMVINHFHALNVDPAILVRAFHEQTDPSARGALLLSLAGYSPTPLPLRDRLVTTVREIYRTESNGYLHSCCEAFLRKSEPNLTLNELRAQVLGPTEITDRKLDWRTHGPFLTMIRIPAPGKIRISHGREVTIDRSFEISNTEIMLGHFLQYFPRHPVQPADPINSDGKPIAFDTPVQEMSFAQIASFCNLLSQTMGLPEDEWCYVAVQAVDDGSLELAPNYRDRKGFRLPTEAEWEFACNSSDENSWNWGASLELLSEYAWCRDSVLGNYVLRPAAMLKPNRLGIFDMHGNADEVTHNSDKIMADEYVTTQKGGCVFNDNRDITQQRRSSYTGGVTRYCGFRIVRRVDP